MTGPLRPVPNRSADAPISGMALRSMTKDGAPWFVALDVCEVLELTAHMSGGYGNHLTKLDADEVTHTLNLGVNVPGSGMHHAKWVSESGLYALIMRNRKPEAQAIRNWVTSVVLSSIRKHGI